MDHPYKITSDLKIIQEEMKVAIQTHQAMRIKFECEPDNMGILKHISDTEKSIQTLGRKQNILVKCLRRYLSSCSADYGLIRQLITKSLASSQNGIVNKNKSIPVSETCQNAVSVLNGLAKGSRLYGVRSNAREKCLKFSGTCMLNSCHILEDTELNRDSEITVEREYECQTRFLNTDAEIKENSRESCRITNILGRNVQEISQVTWRNDTPRIDGAISCSRKPLQVKEDVGTLKLKSSGDVPHVEKYFTAFGMCSENNIQEFKSEPCDSQTKVLPANNSVAVKLNDKDKDSLYLQDTESEGHIKIIKEEFTHRVRRNSNKGVTPQKTCTKRIDLYTMFRDEHLVQRIRNELLSEMKLPEKLGYLSGLGLVTKETLFELQNRRVERKRRSTANHTQFVYGNTWDMSAKKRKKSNYLASGGLPQATRQTTRSQVQRSESVKKPVSVATSESGSSALDPAVVSPPIRSTRSATPTCQPARSTCTAAGKAQPTRNALCKASNSGQTQEVEIPHTTQSTQVVRDPVTREPCVPLCTVPQTFTSRNSKDIQTSLPSRTVANSQYIVDSQYVKSTPQVVGIPQVVFTSHVPHVVQTCTTRIVQRNSPQVVSTSGVAQINQLPIGSPTSTSQASALDKSAPGRSAQGKDSTTVRAFPSLVVPIPQQALFVQPAHFPLIVPCPQVLVRASQDQETGETSAVGNIKPSQGYSSLRIVETSPTSQIGPACKTTHVSSIQNSRFVQDKLPKAALENFKGSPMEGLANSNDLLCGTNRGEARLSDNSDCTTKKPLCAECGTAGLLSFCSACNISVHKECLGSSGICKKCKLGESYMNDSQKETLEVAKSASRSNDTHSERHIQNSSCDGTANKIVSEKKCNMKSTGNQRGTKSSGKNKKGVTNKGHKSTGGSKGKQSKGSASPKKPSADKKSYENQAISPLPQKEEAPSIMKERLEDRKRLLEENVRLKDELRSLKSRVDDLNLSLVNQDILKKDLLSVEEAVQKKIQRIHDFISMVKSPHSLSTS